MEKNITISRTRILGSPDTPTLVAVGDKAAKVRLTGVEIPVERGEREIEKGENHCNSGHGL